MCVDAPQRKASGSLVIKSVVVNCRFDDRLCYPTNYIFMSLIINYLHDRQVENMLINGLYDIAHSTYLEIFTYFCEAFSAEDSK